MLFLVLWIILAIGVGAFATTRGRSFLGWALLSLLFSPLIGFVVVAFLSNAKDEERRHQELLEAVKQGGADPNVISKVRST